MIKETESEMNSIVVHTPIGWVKISEENGILTEITYMGNAAECVQQTTPLLENAKQQLEEYFDGKRKSFDLPLNITGSDFNKAVLKQLAKVPYGETVTYGQLAQLSGYPNAARAVGSVMRNNPFMIVLPCHRVVQAGNRLGNYSAGGTANKDWLLTFEKQNTVPFIPLFLFGQK